MKDKVTTRFGIREIKYEPGKGFSLNGEVRKFKGVCLHHDLGPIGIAINRSALRRQLTILKEMQLTRLCPIESSNRFAGLCVYFTIGLYKIVVVTGIVGFDKKSYLEKVCGFRRKWKRCCFAT